MAPVFPPLPTHFPARMLAAMLCALLAVSPVEGKRYDTQAASDTSSSTTHKSKSGGASTKKPAASTSHATSSPKKPASSAAKKTSSSTHHSATAPRGKKKYVSPAERRRRAARAHKIKLAFVASSELRPMAQQLATLRTPAAYSGVTSYAHAHTGEAAAAAYLALGNAYYLDKRYTDAVASLHQARETGEALDDYADFLAAGRIMRPTRKHRPKLCSKASKRNIPTASLWMRFPNSRPTCC